MALIARTYVPKETALRVTDEYAAALFSFLTVSIIKNGVWGVRTDRVLEPRADWLNQAQTETISSYGVMILLAWVAGTIGRSLGDIQDKLPSAVVLGGVLLFLLANPKPPRRRRRRRAW
jgi:hypothetical protein